MSNPGMKCTRCKGPARHRFPSHNVRFCDDCLEIFIRRQVEKAIKKFHMLEPGQKVVCGISGGKDSLVLWKVLHDLGYETMGLHISLDFGEFSLSSQRASQEIAGIIGRPLTVVSFKEATGLSMEQVVWANRRDFCSVCGTMKRYFMNKLALEMGAQVLATGHHLDDEAGRLLGNLIRGQHHYVERQWPVLEGSEGGEHNGAGLIKKIKPLCRLSGNEIKSYAKTMELPAEFGTCPHAKGATLTNYQEALELLESKMPGTKRNFYLGFLREKGAPPPAPVLSGRCSICNAPSHAEICTTCRLLEKARARFAELEQERLEESVD